MNPVPTSPLADDLALNLFGLIPVTESEIEKGVFSVKGAKNHALFYHRTLNGLSGSNLTEEMANKYIAVLNTDGQVLLL